MQGILSESMFFYEMLQSELMQASMKPFQLQRVRIGMTRAKQKQKQLSAIGLSQYTGEMLQMHGMFFFVLFCFLCFLQE